MLSLSAQVEETEVSHVYRMDDLEETGHDIPTASTSESTLLHARSRSCMGLVAASMILCISLFMNLSLLCMALLTVPPTSSQQSSNHIFTSSVYSPAQEAVRTVQRRFSHLLDTTIYMQPPSDEVDQAWLDLYEFGISNISKSEAAQMLNETILAPGREGQYLITLDIWHQLQCLDTLRQALYPEYYPPMNGTSLEPDLRGPNVAASGPFPGIEVNNVSYCINSIRESLMCNADITPDVWYWDNRVQKSKEVLDMVHQCRDFDSIKAWSLERRFTGEFNTYDHTIV